MGTQNVKSRILVAFFLALAGCAGPVVATNDPPPASTHNVMATSTGIAVGSMSASATLSALPTISSDNSIQTLYKWLEGSDGCLMPCWAGINPGRTTWDEARYLMEPMGGFAKLEYFSSESCVFGECNEIAWSLPSPGDGHGYIYSQLPGNIIHAIIVEITDPGLMDGLSLQNILNKYGKPDMLLFSTEPDQPGQKFLELILVYPDNQFLIKYSRYATIAGDNLESCGTDSYVKLVILDNREQLMSLHAVATAVETKDLNVNMWHKSVEEATGMTIDTFYKTLRQSDTACISTPLSVWQP